MNSKRSLIDCGVVFVSLFPRCPRTYIRKTSPTSKHTQWLNRHWESSWSFINLAGDRRLVLYFLLLSEGRWMFRFSSMINKSWPATETIKLHYNTISLPARLISVLWGTTKADKYFRLSFDLFPASVDRDGRARSKKTPSRSLAIQTSRSVHQRWKQAH